MYLDKEQLKVYPDNHNLNVMPSGLLKGIEDQDLINAKINFFGSLYTENLPKNLEFSNKQNLKL